MGITYYSHDDGGVEANLVGGLANTDLVPLKRQDKFIGHSCLFIIDKRAEHTPAQENMNIYFS